MPLQATSGAASYDGFGGGVPFTPTYIEDVFSTWLYTGNGSTQTITNGIDLSTKGGLVWVKPRSASGSNLLRDTTRGGNKLLITDTTDAESTTDSYPTGNGLQFNNNGFSLGPGGSQNFNNFTFASWTFRKQPKFFDVVTWTGNGASSRTIAHSLGSVPGCIIVKGYSVSGCQWAVYHRSTSANQFLLLNTTDAAGSDFGTYWGNANPTSTNFSVGSATDVNQNGTTYVAYLFAHDAGGFGLTGTDNVISCGSFTVTSGVNTINLGYEPQWVLLKRSSEGGGGWFMEDTMRGMPVSGDARVLFANTSQAEGAASVSIRPTSTGFSIDSGILSTGDTFIYIAIRRGPMKTPTSGTSVYGAAYNYNNDYVNVSTGIVADSAFEAYAGVSDPGSNNLLTRLTGGGILRTANTNAEGGPSSATRWDSMNGMTPGLANNTAGLNALLYTFRRAPGFFDVVCFTSTGSSTQAINHNLGVAPELIIEKVRNNTSDWAVQQIPANKYGSLNSTSAMSSWSSTGIAAPTATVFSPSGFPAGRTEIAYLFASCPGVSKVGSYTGTGALQTINCGFTGGVRWVMIKRADSTGGWFVYDSTRGITSGNDPYLLFNSMAAQVTGTNYVDTTSVGFQVTAAAPAELNANGGTYIFLAIA